MASTPATVTPSGKIALALLPTTHVSFQDDPMLAWGRVLVYGAAAYLLWGKIKPAAYAAAGAAGLCLLSSLSNPVSFKDPYSKVDVLDKPINAGGKMTDAEMAAYAAAHPGEV